MPLTSPARLAKAAGPIDGLKARFKETTCSTSAAALFADLATSNANVIRRVTIVNKSTTSAEIVYVLLGLFGTNWTTATAQSADTVLASGKYIKAAVVPAGSSAEIPFCGDCSVGIISASGTPAFFAVLSDV